MTDKHMTSINLPIDLPSVNHKKYNPATEMLVTKEAISNYLKSAGVTKKEIKAIFNGIDADPFVIGESECKQIVNAWMPGKKFVDVRDKAITTLWEYVNCRRKAYF